jgi:hypothetical protein
MLPSRAWQQLDMLKLKGLVSRAGLEPATR